MSREPTTVDAIVSHRIRMARNHSGVTQQELANRVGVTFQQIQKYEKGVNRCSVGTLVDIARALNVKVEWFIQGFDDEALQPKPSEPIRTFAVEELDYPWEEGEAIAKKYIETWERSGRRV